MALDNSQIPALAAAISSETDPEVLAMISAGNTPGVADWYNAPSSFVVWRTYVTEQEIVSEVSQDGTTWLWSDYIAISVDEKMAWERIFAGRQAIDPSRPHIRSGIGSIFSGPQYANQRAHLLAMAKRNASRAEQLYATGSGTTADPGSLVFEGEIDYRDITKALAL